MAQIHIPEKVFPGFKILSKIDDSVSTNISDYLKGLPIGIKWDSVAKSIEDMIGNQESSSELTKTILSFSKLLDSEDTDVNDLAYNLASSYKELAEPEIKNEDIELLKNNLRKILTSYTAIQGNIKTNRLAYENENILTNSKVITDIRLSFDNEISNGNRAGIVLQKLQIEYQSGPKRKEIYLTLDMDDLKKLKSEIDKAIKNEDIIKEDYKSFINFI
jgi:hypothetical protein